MKDPFREREKKVWRRKAALLGGMFEFRSDHPQLMPLVDAAFAGLPRHRLANRMPDFKMRLTLRSDGGRLREREPPQLRTQGGAGLICATVDADNFVALHPASGSGLMAVSSEMLLFPYHVRYELLEFAVFTLASRAQGLVPLHAACIGRNGLGLLLLGESGAGKSTLTLQCMLQGMELLAEDAVFVHPRSLLATGVPNFLHLRRDSLRFIEADPIAGKVRSSPVIRRRSGIRKFEVDLRQSGFRVAKRPLQIAGVVFVTSRRASGRALLAPIDHARAARRLAASQAYAAGLPSWEPFINGLRKVALFELQRGGHPKEAAHALRGLLDWGRLRR